MTKNKCVAQCILFGNGMAKKSLISLCIFDASSQSCYDQRFKWSSPSFSLPLLLSSRSTQLLISTQKLHEVVHDYHCDQSKYQVLSIPIPPYTSGPLTTKSYF
ncbi:hypothetical protein NL108_005169 [Boleophthalmus pectinirostris]|nr:hypothetical protein NL108_005169 [Boleophthalmus pectinirostris]